VSSVKSLAQKIRKAWDRRANLHADPETDVYRIFHGYGEGFPGLAIDRYGSTAVLTSKGAPPEALEISAAALDEIGEFTCVLAKGRGLEPLALRGTIPGLASEVKELGLRYSVEPWAPRNPGLYLDARPARQWLLANSHERRILNLFSYAGSLGVAAMAGGAHSVVHVDTQKRALKRCAFNHQLNEQHIDARDLVRQDVPQFLRAAAGQEMGGIIVDPPPVAGVRDAANLSPIRLAKSVAALLASGGWVLCFFHHDSRSWDELEEAFCESAGVPLQSIWRSQSGSDFPESDDALALRLSAFKRTT
jgi:23S rRNA (cytosine1962-C5)-methyltransferase